MSSNPAKSRKVEKAEKRKQTNKLFTHLKKQKQIVEKNKTEGVCFFQRGSPSLHLWD